jgi:neutral ceramidase
MHRARFLTPPRTRKRRASPEPGRRRWFRIPAAIFLMFVLYPVTGAESEPSVFRAGSSLWEITPSPGSPMSGYGDRDNRPSEGIHDRLFCRCLVLEMDGTRVALVSADLLAFNLSLRHAVLEKLRDLSLDLVFLAATHTHSGPGGYEKGWATEKFLMGTFQEGAVDYLSSRIASSVREAAGRLRPARIAYGQGQAPDLCRNRRHDGAPTDSSVGVLWVEAGETGRPIALALNFGAHPTVLGPENLLYSGDYAGMTSARLEETTGAPVLFFSGTLADLKPHLPGTREWEAPLEEQYREAEAIAEALGREVLRVKSGLTPEPVHALAAAQRRVKLPRVNLRSSCFYYVFTPAVRLLFHDLFHGETLFQAVRMNDWVLAGIPAEISTELGAQIRQGVPAREVMLAGLANDTLGYALTPDDYRQGGYEACMSFFGKNTGPFFVDQARAAIEQVSPGKGVSSEDKRALR